MKNKPTLVVMAAGMGSRYGGLKQMDPIGNNGELIIDFSLYDAKAAGFDTVICIIKKEIEKDFKALMDCGAAKKMNILYAYQEIESVPDQTRIPPERTKPWGTGHAVLQIKNLVEGPFAVINADDYYGKEAFASIYRYLESTADINASDFCMAGYSIEKTLTENGHVARGVCNQTSDGYLSDIQERTKIQTNNGVIQFTEDEKTWHDIPQGTLVSMNLFGFTPSFLDELEKRFPLAFDNILKTNPLKGEFYVPLVVGELIQEKKATVKVLETNEQWYGVTYREDKPIITRAMERKKADGEYPQSLWT
ncbi:MAG: nucleotidyltransferase [Clostridia bacterium]|nr:nucleotidyltransferase [Clostridia bacterium]